MPALLVFIIATWEIFGQKNPFHANGPFGDILIT